MPCLSKSKEISQLKKYLSLSLEDKLLCLDLETDSLDFIEAQIVGVGLMSPSQPPAYVPIQHQMISQDIKQLELKSVLAELQAIFNSPELSLIGHNLKYDLSILKQHKLSWKLKLEDTLLQAFIIQPKTNSLSLDALASHYFNYSMQSFKELTTKDKTQLTFDQVELSQALDYAAEDVWICFELYKLLFKKIKTRDQNKLYQLELAVLESLIDLESAGVLIDVDYFAAYAKQLQGEVETLESEIFKLAPEKFNLNSPKQLSYILFEKMGIKEHLKKTKTGYSTDQKVLELLAKKHPIAKLITSYRLKQKLINTYLLALPKQISPKTGRIHASFNQAVVSTGRLSSSKPNLQNIPIRGEERAKLRTGFIAAENNILIAADYSQIELRVLAHLSGDPGLIEAFNQDKDIHAITATKLFKITQDSVTQEQRGIAKAINFGLLYGMGVHRLSAEIKVSYYEANNLINEYFISYPKIKGYMSEVIELVKKQGYVETMFKRRRYLSDIYSKNHQARMAAERVAMNTPIQGGAADIIKLAMEKLNIALKEIFKPEAARLIMQVHDELVIECEEHLKTDCLAIIKEAMESAAELIVPLKVNIGWGKNWSEASH